MYTQIIDTTSSSSPVPIPGHTVAPQLISSGSPSCSRRKALRELGHWRSCARPGPKKCRDVTKIYIYIPSGYLT